MPASFRWHDNEGDWHNTPMIETEQKNINFSPKAAPQKKSVADQEKRALLLDPTQSFIVQAPAGSGKTALLIQRFLVLLARVNSPEEVIAITFTKKAAMEMRERILEALKKVAAGGEPPQEDYAKCTWDLGLKVLEQDKKLNWRLLQNPSRLRLQTIDSLSHQIVHQAPIASEFGTITDVTENGEQLYTNAIYHLLKNANESGGTVSNALKKMLLHLNNDGSKVQRLLMGMLAARDQWMGHVFGQPERAVLEKGLEHLNLHALKRCSESFPEHLEDEMLRVLRFSLANQTEQPVVLENFPSEKLEDKFIWQAIGRLFLKKDGGFRQAVTRSMGFPAESSTKDLQEKAIFAEMKKRFKALVEELKPYENWRIALAQVLILPNHGYTETQWEILSALMIVLKYLVGELRLVFHETGQVDFVEMAQAAVALLGDEDQPSDLSLAWDYKIQHLLIDEFQDTSITQFNFVERLTAGWQPHENRTLFVVGDPMQSIYRFRQAEVGLFLIAQQEGIGHIALTPVTLEVNFRSEKVVLDWVNSAFKSVFPKTSNIDLGAVDFAPSKAFHENTSEEAVFAHYVTPGDEASKIVKLIKGKKRTDPEASIGLLVRSRTHLKGIMPALLAAEIPFQALDITPLKAQPIIYDLLSLTRVLLLPSDRLAWLSILRAPWCGLSLRDLHTLVYRFDKTPFLEILENIPDDLSEEGKKRLIHVKQIVLSAIRERGRGLASDWIEDTWIKLNAPLCYEAVEIENYAKSYFDLLYQMSQNSGWIDLEQLESNLAKQFATDSASGPNDLQVMTIHKSKGLEFDMVIIPGLQRKPRASNSPILRWLEQASFEQTSRLVLAPIKGPEGIEDEMYEYLGMIEKKKSMHELERLLYVAATRAKSSLNWVIEDHQKKPASGSFYSLLEKTLPRPPENPKEIETNETSEEAIPAHEIKIRRLKLSYFRQSEDSLINLNEDASDPIEFPNNQIILSEKIGTVIHFLLEQIGREGLEADWIQNKAIYKKYLMAEGVLPRDMDFALEKISSAMSNLQKDSTAKWIFDSAHQEAHDEYPLAFYEKNKVKHIRVDRTFIDEKGERWVIDYKTSEPKEGESLDDFLERMKVIHKDQFLKYAHVFSLMEEKPVHLRLYFPLVPAWCEVD